MSNESVMASNHLIFCCPLLLLPSIFSSIRVFSSESALHNRWPKYWSFSFRINPSNEYLGLISSRIDWFDLLAVQRTLKSLLQCYSSKASVLWCSAFFMAQLSHQHITIGKTISSVQFSHSVVYDSVTRLPCPSLNPGACSNSCPLNQWCHQTTLSLSSPSPPAFNPFWYQDLFQ